MRSAGVAARPLAPQRGGRAAARAPGDQDVFVLVCPQTGEAAHVVPIYRREFPEALLLVVVAVESPDYAADVLELGADDVVATARVERQLVARVRALQRRHNFSEGVVHPATLRAGALCVDFDAQKVWIGDDELALSPTEFRLFRTLSMHLGRVVTHREILDQVWGEHRPETVRALRVYIRHIRRKVRDAGDAIQIVVRPGIGYMLTVPAS